MTAREAIVDGVRYVFDDTGADGGNGCQGCAAPLNPEGRELCEELPECKGGIWRAVA